MPTERLILTALMMLLAGCGAIRSSAISLSTFDEPRDGPRARLRLVTERPAPELYPNRSCIGGNIQGAGIAPSSRPGPFGTGSGQKIGIPAVAVSGGRFVTEAHLRAGEPITLSLSAGGCMDNRCSLNTPLCTVSRSFVPQAGQDYVATIFSRGPECEVEVSRIVIQQGRTRLMAEQTSPASRCGASN
ncbi:hypothetical protein [Xanthomonas vesicatoria]|uniref:Secreted protein n=1 Tax=Xanthomonas vesicatoria TaxID=56460 RepID=A0ABS8L789_9XANT|nr:hypothetical protein [Xanthomonas vesicatoria]APO97034.1 hypothetical protein BI313_22780 [Xanthomonas vesicatoria]APP77186.1 hypothetical protein BJD12_20355 [Xanthomonas vesicatoria ATCC 35937]MCC8558066.1 hypothetical protein [Xanthomonas vesicatoria]MCC8597435.1 hypothetical protein [Xanthomonas vesicatoria]MCC8599621.1 hypothetical protein [Xanthomonas vesicatoria]